MMKIKNVIKGLLAEYDIKEINILNDERCIFSGTPDEWRLTDPSMISCKREIENMEIKKRLMLNYTKAFLFI